MKKQAPLFYILSVIAVFAVSSSTLEAQTQWRRAYRKASKELKNNQRTLAEEEFRKALTIDSTNNYALFGLGNTQYEQGKYAEAADTYKKISVEAGTISQQQAAELYHNLGNSQMKQKQYAQAAEFYKQSLRLNPTDNETRYNLTLALKLMEKNNQQQPQQNQQQPNPNPKENKSQQDKQNSPQNNPENQQNQQIDPKTSNQILDSYKQDDDKTRQKFEERKRNQQAQPEDNNKKQW